jgi:hypothetical protein
MTDGGDSAGIVSAITAWVTTNVVWIALISVSYFVISLLAIRFLIIRMPADYFLKGKRDPSRYVHPVAVISLRIARNLLGLVVIVVGLVMSLPGVPGQGVLTLLIGLTLTDFPGKRRMELWFLRRPVIHTAINSLRGKAGKPPLILPDGEGDDPERGVGRGPTNA